MPKWRPTEVRAVADLRGSERAEMLALFGRHFERVDPAAFHADLDEKEHVALVAGPDGRLAGFSTLVRITATVRGQAVAATFSGDTIVDPSARHAAALPRLLSRHIFAAARAEPGVPAYWFLLSSGYKTYRLLPHLFRTFLPGGNAPPTAAEAAVLGVVARARYGERFDAGIVRLAHPTPLRPGVADLTEHRLRDPHVAFFARANPGHAAGDELACLTRVHPDNLTAAGLRTVGPDLTEGWPGSGMRK